mmetsp:Transcript_20347/g.45448  ORF Transcript_20347/g.45448 Transcript_20347/m.45448 type:complete len:135 (+) Transcript_20347:569-973(+)
MRRKIRDFILMLAGLLTRSFRNRVRKDVVSHQQHPDRIFIQNGHGYLVTIWRDRHRNYSCSVSSLHLSTRFARSFDRYSNWIVALLRVTRRLREKRCRSRRSSSLSLRIICFKKATSHLIVVVFYKRNVKRELE